VISTVPSNTPRSHSGTPVEELVPSLELLEDVLPVVNEPAVVLVEPSLLVELPVDEDVDPSSVSGPVVTPSVSAPRRATSDRPQPVTASATHARRPTSRQPNRDHLLAIREGVSQLVSTEGSWVG
jgi:hypothetical protein